MTHAPRFNGTNEEVLRPEVLRRLESLKGLAQVTPSDMRETFYQISAVHLLAKASPPAKPDGTPLEGEAAVQFWGDYIFSKIGEVE